jgi:tRNA uridine 5-carbamoylmethylation protein Kti12
MPLLLLTGPPASGKTTIAKRVVEAFEARDVHPILISDILNSEFARSADFYLEKRKVR